MGDIVNRHEALVEPETVRLAHVEPVTEALGPGRRSAVYVQGCHLRCPNCLVPEWWPFDGGAVRGARALAAELLTLGSRAITFSGGEPTMQAAGLVTVIDAMRNSVPDLSVMVYTGYRLPYLLRQGTRHQHALLERTDILVDSPYVDRWHGDLRWRGSRNQRILLLSDRHAPDELLPDESVGVELVVGPDLLVRQIGVPYHP